MKLAKAIFSFILAVSFCQDISASRNHIFRHITIDEGLHDNSITAATVDHYGFLWFGSKTGITRYDGHDFIPFEEYDSIDSFGGWVFDLREDNEGMMWFASHCGVGYYNPASGEITMTTMTAERDTHIEQDGQGRIWLTRSDLIYRYDKDSKKIDTFPAEQEFSCVNSCTDSNGIMWFAGNDGLLRRFDDKHQVFVEIPVLDEPDIREGESIQCIQTISNAQILIGTSACRLLKMDVVSGAIEELPVRIDRENRLQFQQILEREHGEYWIATSYGLYIYNDIDKSTEYIGNNDYWELGDLNVMCMVSDRENNMWIGTFHSGLGVWYNEDESLKRYFPDGKAGSVRGSNFHSIAEDREGNIWIGTLDGHLHKLNSQTRMIEEIQDEKLGWQMYYCIMDVDGQLWIGTYGNSIYILDSHTGKIVGHKELDSNRIVCMVQSPDGNILVGTAQGLYRYNRETDSFTYDNRLGDTMIHTICFDSTGTLWVGSYRDGLYILQPGSNVYEHITTTPYRAEGLKSDYITFLFEDIDQTMWIGSEGGCLSGTSINDPQHQFRSYDTRDGFPTNTTGSIAQDSMGYLWIGTTGGLVKFDPNQGRVIDVHYDASHTIGNCYIYDSVCKSSRGSIYMGTHGGVIVFYPEKIKSHSTDIPLYITDIVSKESEGSTSLYLQEGYPIGKDRIRIAHNKAKLIEISYTALSFSPDIPVTYEYSLSKIGKEVISKTTNNSVILNNLRQGHLTFRIKVAGSESPISEKILRIRIVPSIWHCNAAIVIYLLALIALLWYGIESRARRKDMMRRAQIEELQNTRDKELYDSKIKFFTNITHEIRTPLSLIKMPLDKIIRNKEYSPEAEDDIKVIQRNSERLLEMTNQLLNMRKIETLSQGINFAPCDVGDIIGACAAQFESAAKNKGIVMHTLIPENTLEAILDIESTKTIVCNLISNAIKYSRENIWISVDKEQGSIKIHIDSDGELITGDDRNRIFEPFFRLSEEGAGTGLGLSYAKTLAKKMNGKLAMDDKRADVNSFVLSIPLVQDFVKDTDSKDNIDRKSDEYTESSQKGATLLVVEDSSEMRQYLAKELSGEYRVLEARDGMEAIEILGANKIDMVISDIMMPEMNGCELCNQIKSDVEYSHIPVILLTAAVGVDKHIESLKMGADGYIEKPFTVDLLKANIYNIFKNKEISFRQFTASPLSHFSSSATSSIDNEFMERLHKAIMENMADKELGIEDLVELMRISKATLYRKIKANTGLNTSEYVRLCRLKKAAELLASYEYRINEVAYMVGFTSPSYFATAFQKQFNISPSAFVKNLLEKTPISNNS